jgi:hypothetical protein
MEVALAAEVAKAINDREGTDYRAIPVKASDDIADVILRSAGGAHADRGVQVVTVPFGNIRSRMDSDHRGRGPIGVEK